MHVIRLTQGVGVKTGARQHSRHFFAQRWVPDSCLCQTKAALLSSPRLVIRAHRTHNQASHQPERDISRTHQHDHSSGVLLLPMITGHHQLRTCSAPTPSYIFAAPRTYTCGSASLTTGGETMVHSDPPTCGERYADTAPPRPTPDHLNSDTSSDLPPLRLQFELTDPQPEIRTRTARDTNPSRKIPIHVRDGAVDGSAMA